MRQDFAPADAEPMEAVHRHVAFTMPACSRTPGALARAREGPNPFFFYMLRRVQEGMGPDASAVGVRRPIMP